MPASPTRGELRYGGNPAAAQALDDFDRAEAARSRHRGKYPARACHDGHPGDAEGRRWCTETVEAIDAARVRLREAEANPPTTKEATSA